MARRKINLQNTERSKPATEISQLVQDLGTTDLGFSPTESIVYEIDLDKVRPDFTQSRHILPNDLRELLVNEQLTATEAMQRLVKRSEEGDQVAKLILGGEIEVLDEDHAEVITTEERGLLALAASIRDVGLRQPINVYRLSSPDNPSLFVYQIGEGERRYWAHHLLVTQGHSAFTRIRCSIEPMPDDQAVVQRRQEAENAARQDLSALARARSIRRIYDRLNLELGTRVPGKTTIILPNKRDLQKAVGQEVKSFTGRAISDRMVRNYLRLLDLSSELQDLVEAAQLTEKQLRPVTSLKLEAEQAQVIQQIIREKLSGSAVMARIRSGMPVTSLRRTMPTTLEQRLEKRLFQTAKTVHEIVSLGIDSYTDAIRLIAPRIRDGMTRESLMALRRVIDDLIGDGDVTPTNIRQVTLNSIEPPLDVLRPNLPEMYQQKLSEVLTGLEIMAMVLDWRQDDPLVSSTLHRAFDQIESQAARLRAGEEILRPIVIELSDSEATIGQYTYRLLTGKVTYWAYALLAAQTHQGFDSISVELNS